MAIPKPSGASARWKSNMFKVIGKSNSNANGIRVPDKRSTPQMTWIEAMNGRKYGALNNPITNSAAAPVGGGADMKCKNLLRPNTRKINPSIILAICAVMVNALLFEYVTAGGVRTPGVECVIILFFNDFDTAKLAHEAADKKGWKRQFYVNISF